MPLQFQSLVAKLPLLAINAPEKGGDFSVTLVGQGGIQIDVIEGRNNFPREPNRKEHREEESHRKDDTNGLCHPQKQQKNRALGTGQAQDCPVRQALGAVEQTVHQGIRIAPAAPIALCHGLGHLFPLQMVRHFLSVRFAVIQDRAVGSDPGDAVVFQGEALEVIAALVGNPLGSQACLYSQLRLLDVGKMGI